MCWLISFVCSLLICSLQHAEAIVACPPTTTCARTRIAWHRLLVGVLVLCALRGAEKSTGHSMHVVLHCIFPRVFLSARQVFARLSVSSLVTVAVCIVYTCHIVGYCTQVRHMLQPYTPRPTQLLLLQGCPCHPTPVRHPHHLHHRGCHYFPHPLHYLPQRRSLLLPR